MLPILTYPPVFRAPIGGDPIQILLWSLALDN